MKTQEINYSLGDQNFKAYVAHPELDKAPLILIAHTWAGKDDFVELKARELAEEGFIAMAVDMYGDGRVGSSTEENQSMMAPLVDDREKLKSVINAALQAGKKLEGVDSSKIAAILVESTPSSSFPAFKAAFTMDLSFSLSSTSGVIKD